VLLCGPLVPIDEAAEDGSALDPLLGGVRDGVVGAELAASMGPPPVVVSLVLGQNRPQVPFAEISIRISVRARTPGRDFRDLDTGTGQHRAATAAGAICDTAAERSSFIMPESVF